MKAIIENLCKFMEESTVGETRVLLRADESGFGEPIYITNVNGAALVHFDTTGDWTRAVLIPPGEIETGRAVDALAWFLEY